MKISILRDLCVGTAACLDLAPETYELDNEGKAIISKSFDLSKATEEQKQKALEGAKACPTKAIIVTDDSGKQIWPES